MVHLYTQGLPFINWTKERLVHFLQSGAAWRMERPGLDAEGVGWCGFPPQLPTPPLFLPLTSMTANRPTDG